MEEGNVPSQSASEEAAILSSRGFHAAVRFTEPVNPVIVIVSLYCGTMALGGSSTYDPIVQVGHHKHCVQGGPES